MLTDTDPMPFGKYKGLLMQDVPASYLVWLRDEKCSHPEVAKYIKDNWNAILMDCPDYIDDGEDCTEVPE